MISPFFLPVVNCNNKSDSRAKKFKQQTRARKSAH